MQPRILVPYDFSPTAEAALRYAVDLHRSCGGAIKLVHIVPISTLAPAGELPLMVPTDEELKTTENELRQAGQNQSIAAEVEVLVAADIASGVLGAATAWNAELIAMGTHGRGGVKRLLLGSVADVVVRSASCPVVTVRGPA